MGTAVKDAQQCQMSSYEVALVSAIEDVKRAQFELGKHKDAVCELDQRIGGLKALILNIYSILPDDVKLKYMEIVSDAGGPGSNFDPISFVSSDSVLAYMKSRSC